MSALARAALRLSWLNTSRRASRPPGEEVTANDSESDEWSANCVRLRGSPTPAASDCSVVGIDGRQIFVQASVQYGSAASIR